MQNGREHPKKRKLHVDSNKVGKDLSGKFKELKGGRLARA